MISLIKLTYEINPFHENLNNQYRVLLQICRVEESLYEKKKAEVILLPYSAPFALIFSCLTL